jgi:hypothetical protein
MYLNNTNNHYLSAGQVEVMPPQNRIREGQTFILLSSKWDNLPGMAELVNRLNSLGAEFELVPSHTEKGRIFAAQILLQEFEEKVGPYITQEKEDRSYLETL